MIRAHKEGKTLKEIAAMLPGRTFDAVEKRWHEARKGRWGTAALIAYAAECNPQKNSSWSAEKDQTFIRAHKEGKTWNEIAAMLPVRSEGAVASRWGRAKMGNNSAALRAYASEYCLQR